MDEPLGALDRKLRDQMQLEIKRIHRSVGTTFIYVTHDQSEALTMSDLVVLMHRGRIAQTGAPRKLYTEPASVFVADFIGDSNLLHGRVTAVDNDTITVALDVGPTIEARPHDRIAYAPGDRVAAMLRPEDIAVRTPGGAAPGTGLSGTVSEIGYQGDTCKLSVTVGGEAIKVKVPPHQALALDLGSTVDLSWEQSAVRLLSIDDREVA
jgi:putative spermidine/putrescine transport system ATP-binding protein